MAPGESLTIVSVASQITVEAPGYTNVIEGSFAGASGVMTVQQNNGNNSAMPSAVFVIANGISFGFN